ncbi:MAG: hypothetical protein ACYDBB_16265 [Armatimonadota bacterium]
MEEMQTAKSFSELTSREKAIEVVRWVAVLPTAIVGSILPVLFYVLSAYLGFFRSEDADPQDWFTVSPLIKLAFAFAVGSAFIYAGSAMAPRYQRYTAIIITVVFVFISCFTFAFLATKQTDIDKYLMLMANAVGAIATGITLGKAIK